MRMKEWPKKNKILNSKISLTTQKKNSSLSKLIRKIINENQVYCKIAVFFERFKKEIEKKRMESKRVLADPVVNEENPVNTHIKALDDIKKIIKEEVEKSKKMKERLVKEMREKEKLKKLFGLVSEQMQKEITEIENESFLDKSKVHAFNKIGSLLEKEKMLGFVYDRIFRCDEGEENAIRYSEEN